MCVLIIHSDFPEILENRKEYTTCVIKALIQEFRVIERGELDSAMVLI